MLGNLGFAQIIVGVMLAMIQKGMSDNAAAAAAAQQYKELRDMKEAPLMALSVEMERHTGTPHWEWFNTLRSAQRLAIIGNGNGTQPPLPLPKPKQDMATWIWVAGGAALLFILLEARR